MFFYTRFKSAKIHKNIFARNCYQKQSRFLSFLFSTIIFLRNNFILRLFFDNCPKHHSYPLSSLPQRSQSGPAWPVRNTPPIAPPRAKESENETLTSRLRFDSDGRGISSGHGVPKNREPPPLVGKRTRRLVRFRIRRERVAGEWKFIRDEKHARRRGQTA